MLSSVIRVLTGRTAAVLAMLAALALAVALGSVWTAAGRNEARLETRIAALHEQLARSVALQKAEAAACQVAAEQKRVAAGAAGDPTARLLQAPEGFDVCARMESADAAVLGSLR
jgi:hypothetical protein